MKIIEPEYYGSFKCIGSECTSTCCMGWNIWIDKESFFKYKNEQDDFSKKLKKSIRKKDECEDDNDYGEFILDYNKRCSLLNKKNLCELYINKGEEYLCRTCTIFPRTSNNYIEENLEKNLECSCPVVAEYLVSNKDGINFIEKEEEITELDERIITEWYDGDIIKDKLTLRARDVFINIAKDRSINLNNRIFKIKVIQDKIQKYLERDNTGDLDSILGTDIIIEKSDLESRELEKYGIIFELINYIFSEQFYIDERLDEYINILIDYISEMNIDKSKTFAYKEKQFKEIFKEKNYVLENYLVYDIYKNYMGSIVDYDGDRIINLAIVTQSILNSFFVSYWSKYNKLSDKTISNIITLYEKYMQEDFVRETIVEFLEEKNIKSLEKLTILL